MLTPEAGIATTITPKVGVIITRIVMWSRGVAEGGGIPGISAMVGIAGWE